MSLKTLRTQLHVTQAEVASASGVDQATISRIEAREDGSHSMATLLQIQKGLRELARLKKRPMAIFLNDIYREKRKKEDTV
ncbi:MAG: helix-turn-helix transcriptional regulator [Planctomycetota bacterium]